MPNGDKGSGDILPRTLSAIFQPRVVVLDRCRASALHDTICRSAGRTCEDFTRVLSAVVRAISHFPKYRVRRDYKAAAGPHPANPEDRRRPPSLSGCIVPSNYRCASCALQHLSLPHVKHATSFHRCVLPESLEPCHGIPAGLTECLVYFYIDIIHNCVIYHNNHIIRYYLFSCV